MEVKAVENFKMRGVFNNARHQKEVIKKTRSENIPLDLAISSEYLWSLNNNITVVHFIFYEALYCAL